MENVEIQQIIPLQQNVHLFHDPSIIALALVRKTNGEQELAYIVHDPAAGRPVLRGALPTHHQGN